MQGEESHFGSQLGTEPTTDHDTSSSPPYDLRRGNADSFGTEGEWTSKLPPSKDGSPTPRTTDDERAPMQKDEEHSSAFLKAENASLRSAVSDLEAKLSKYRSRPSGDRDIGYDVTKLVQGALPVLSTALRTYGAIHNVLHTASTVVNVLGPPIHRAISHYTTG
ncbi:hypothetical protein BD324DRAFT_653043 [Kockovaella imperatae]|uniref:Uncharacterized protein n=1 Tax=Kockovaella imperatae TaxID=4999 RepID=A0A1Y1UCI5_9TREE|nr:hypothetical protein BD324DRAFT_653043 [Kockovaella imperatae]ORX34785.1 hypothetical protein BD324DRAFT_653043 [Kockovaella imperatae]